MILQEKLMGSNELKQDPLSEKRQNIQIFPRSLRSLVLNNYNWPRPPPHDIFHF